MTKEELNQKREELGEEILKALDGIREKIREYADLAGETRPMVFYCGGHVDDPYTDSKVYISLNFLRKKYGMTTDEAVAYPNLFNVTRFDDGTIYHRLARERFLGEEETEEER